jgi:oligopeptide/dipeptide ABC transporter ATP-binding protein
MEGKKERLHVIPGTLPNPTGYPKGCRFFERCDRSSDKCKDQPEEIEISQGHSSACWHMD